MSKDDFYQKTRRECASLLRYDADNLSAEQSTRLDCVIALRLVVDDMQSKLLRGETVDVGKLLAATQELSRLLPEPEERVITAESARQKLLEVVLNIIAAEDAESSQAASEMEAAAAALEGPGGAQELARLRAASEPITPRECDVLEPMKFAVGGVPRGPGDRRQTESAAAVTVRDCRLRLLPKPRLEIVHQRRRERARYAAR